MDVVGLLMIADEDDILDRVLGFHQEMVDATYVLDGTANNRYSRQVCNLHGVDGYWRDKDLPRPPYPEKPVDGYRQFLLEKAYERHGHDITVALLHGDEVWEETPREILGEFPDADGWIFDLPCYFPRDEWRDDEHPFDQLVWNLRPGWPEVRMFRGGSGVNFNPRQHFNVTPSGLRHIVSTGVKIRHYPYRSPARQRARAKRHAETGFDPDNYTHILEGDQVIWTDERIREWQRNPCWQELRKDD